MSFDKPIRRVAVVATGVIGASWAAQYLARGLDVIATDPAPNAEDNLRKYVDEAWGQLEEIGLSAGASRDRLSFIKDMGEALAEADFVQENGPERPDFKMKLFADMDEATPVDKGWLVGLPKPMSRRSIWSCPVKPSISPVKAVDCSSSSVPLVPWNVAVPW